MISNVNTLAKCLRYLGRRENQRCMLTDKNHLSLSLSLSLTKQGPVTSKTNSHFSLVFPIFIENQSDEKNKLLKTNHSFASVHKKIIRLLFNCQTKALNGELILNASSKLTGIKCNVFTIGFVKWQKP